MHTNLTQKQRAALQRLRPASGNLTPAERAVTVLCAAGCTIGEIIAVAELTPGVVHETIVSAERKLRSVASAAEQQAEAKKLRASRRPRSADMLADLEETRG